MLVGGERLHHKRLRQTHQAQPIMLVVAMVLRHHHVRDLVLAHELLEFAVGDGRDRLPADPEILQGQHAEDGEEDVGEIEAGLSLVHGVSRGA